MDGWKEMLAASLEKSSPEESSPGVFFRDGETAAWLVQANPGCMVGCVNATQVLDFAPGTLRFHSCEWSPPGRARLGISHRSRPWNDGLPLDANGETLYPEVDFDAIFSNLPMRAYRADGSLIARIEPSPDTIAFEPYRKIARDPIPVFGRRKGRKKAEGPSPEDGDA